MSMANTLQDFLQRHHARFDMKHHAHSSCSMETAAMAHVPGDRLAKPVMFRDDLGYVMAVLPSTCHVGIAALNKRLGRHLQLAEEWELEELFQDCELGAIPPMGPAYGIRTVMDEDLANERDIYFEAGNHEDLIHMQMDAFLDLMADADRARFSRRL
ncbi:MAG: YbaK/EbsC family protein [Rhodocyclales bacterium]|nr:YbaK/EbsC family protein [Rhodocyclales bacterium]